MFTSLPRGALTARVWSAPALRAAVFLKLIFIDRWPIYHANSIDWFHCTWNEYGAWTKLLTRKKIGQNNLILYDRLLQLQCVYFVCLWAGTQAILIIKELYLCCKVQSLHHPQPDVTNCWVQVSRLVSSTTVLRYSQPSAARVFDNVVHVVSN